MYTIVLIICIYSSTFVLKYIKIIYNSISSNSCSSRRAGFKSQYPHDNLQGFVTPVPKDSTPSSGLCEHQAYMWCRQNICTHKQMHTFLSINKLKTWWYRYCYKLWCSILMTYFTIIQMLIMKLRKCEIFLDNKGKMSNCM